MARYPMYIEQRPSIWHQILSGLGMGITQGVELAMRNREYKRSLVGDLLSAVVQRKISPELIATPTMQNYLKTLGIHQEKPILELAATGQDLWKKRQPEIGPPEPLTDQALIRREALDLEAAEEQEFERKLNQDIEIMKRKEKEKRILQKSFAKEDLEDAYKFSKEKGWPIQNMTQTADGKYTIDFLMPPEKEEAERKIREAKRKEVKAEEKDINKAREKYLDDTVKAQTMRRSAIRSLTQIQSGEPTSMPEILNSIRSMLSKPSDKLNEQDLKKMSTEEIVKLVRHEYNKEISAWNSVLKEGHRTAKMREPIQKIALIGANLDEVEPAEAPTIADTRGSIMLTAPKVPTEAEIQAEVENLIKAGLVDENGNLLTRERARKIVLEAYGIKER